MKQAVCIACMSCALTAIAQDHAATARDFVEKGLIATNIFVYNPPADRNPYATLSRTELQNYQQATMRNGALLFLFPNAMPAKLQSRLDYKEHGEQRTWYADGFPQSVETYERGQLVAGEYLSPSGKSLSHIRNGSGVKTIFGESLDERSTSRPLGAYRPTVLL